MTKTYEIEWSLGSNWGVEYIDASTEAEALSTLRNRFQTATQRRYVNLIVLSD